MISKKQNIVFSLLFSAIFLLIFSSSYSQKTLRVGYINMDYILENLDDYNQQIKNTLKPINGKEKLKITI